MIEYEFLNHPRDLRCGDAVDINRLLAQSARPTRVDHCDILNTMHRGMLLVARDTESVDEGGRPKIVGMGTMFPLPALRRSHGHMEDLLVAKGYDDKDVAKAIAAKLLDQAKNLGLPYVEIVSDQAWGHELFPTLGCTHQAEANVYHYRIAR